MKKSNQNVITVSSFVLALMSSSALWAQNCATPPTCESLGYTKTLQDCSGLNSLKCPFDTSKVYCTTYNDLDPLAVGDFVYEDLSTSRPERYQTELAKGKKLRGVVVNTNKRIAVQITEYSLTYIHASQTSSFDDLLEFKEIHDKLKTICPTVTINNYWEVGYDGRKRCTKEVKNWSLEKKSGKDLTKQLLNLLGKNVLTTVNTGDDYYLPSADDLSEIGYEEAVMIQNNLASIGLDRVNMSLNTALDCITVKLTGECGTDDPNFTIVDGEAVHFFGSFVKSKYDISLSSENFKPFLEKGTGQYEYYSTPFSLFFNF